MLGQGREKLLNAWETIENDLLVNKKKFQWHSD